VTCSPRYTMHQLGLGKGPIPPDSLQHIARRYGSCRIAFDRRRGDVSFFFLSFVTIWDVTLTNTHLDPITTGMAWEARGVWMAFTTHRDIGYLFRFTCYSFL
jgi:hypothetical protein